MEDPVDVPDCLRRWKLGDESAARSLILHLYPVVSKIVRTHLPRRDHEEDLIQDIFMKMFSRLHQYQSDAPLAHWVSRLALTTCVDRLRSQKARPELRYSDLTLEESAAFDSAWRGEGSRDPLAALQARDLVQRILETLPGPDRALILMADLEGRSIAEISNVMGWRIPKTKMYLYRLRARLRESLRRLGEK